MDAVLPRTQPFEPQSPAEDRPADAPPGRLRDEPLAAPAPTARPEPSPAQPAPIAASPRPSRRWRFRVTPKHPLSLAALVLYALAIALGVGFGSAAWTLSRGFLFGGVKAGPWLAWPRVGSREADPYARAVVARRGDIPLGTGEGLAFTAVEDSAGRTLDTGCTYRIGAVTPPARLWTLTLYDATNQPFVSELGRAALTSAELLREGDGRFAITLSRDPAPGNWLRLPESGRVSLVLRLYDTPVAAGSAALDATSLPAIERTRCRA